MDYPKSLPNAGLVGGKFVDEDTGTGTPGSLIPSAWGNSITDEVLNVIKGAGDVPDETKFDQLLQAIQKLGGGAVGSTRNVRMNVTAASATATLTADEVVVSTALGGRSFRLPSLNKTINLDIAGAGGMDTGTATASGFVAIYAIYNPTTGASALLAANANSAAAPEIYGGANMPAGYTASALVSIAPISSTAGQFAPFFQLGRSVDYQGGNVITGSSAVVTNTARLASFIPMNAKAVSGFNQIGNTSAVSVSQVVCSTANNSLGGQFNTQNIAAGTASAIPFKIPVSVPQTIYQTTSSGGGTASFTIAVRSYDF